MKPLHLIAAGLLMSVAIVPAQAVTLNFAGLDGNRQELIREYYNGGTGGHGSGPGVNYGISFSNNAYSCSVQPDGLCDSAGLPTGGNLLVFVGGTASTMNVSGGFDTGFSLYYSAVNEPAFVNIYAGLDGTGDLLATLSLAMTPSTPNDPACFGASFCPYAAAGVTFAGIAHSVDFGGSKNQVAFAAITLGASAAAVPEPSSWALMIGGFGMAGVALRRRKVARVA